MSLPGAEGKDLLGTFKCPTTQCASCQSPNASEPHSPQWAIESSYIALQKSRAEATRAASRGQTPVSLYKDSQPEGHFLTISHLLLDFSDPDSLDREPLSFGFSLPWRQRPASPPCFISLCLSHAPATSSSPMHLLV